MQTPTWILAHFFFLTLILGCSEKEDVQSTNESAISIFQYLSAPDSPLLRIDTDWSSLIEHKEAEAPQTAKLILADKGAILDEIEFEVAARGKTRKKYCDIPPIKLRFSKKFLRQKRFAKYKSLKLVIPCKPGSTFEDLLLREYLAYQLFAALSEHTFQTQLVRLSLYQDGQIHGEDRWAFIIEHEDEMAARLGGSLREAADGKLRTIDRASYDLMVLLQYMIGNTDWNLSSRHNIKLVEQGAKQAPIPVPYDFDYCGLVNADYASPHPNLPVESIRERLFQWRGKDQAGLEKVIFEVLKKKQMIIKMISDFELLSLESRNDIQNFVQTFFDIISSEHPAKRLLEAQSAL